LDFFQNLINFFITALQIAIFGRILLSWISLPQGNIGIPITKFLIEITDPILEPIKRIIPQLGMFDFSPMIALILLNLIKQGVSELFSKL
jgi:YggT family protein